jgi:hypothetical protein
LLQYTHNLQIWLETHELMILMVYSKYEPYKISTVGHGTCDRKFLIQFSWEGFAKRPISTRLWLGLRQPQEMEQ